MTDRKCIKATKIRKKKTVQINKIPRESIYLLISYLLRRWNVIRKTKGVKFRCNYLSVQVMLFPSTL